MTFTWSLLQDFTVCMVNLFFRILLVDTSSPVHHGHGQKMMVSQVSLLFHKLKNPSMFTFPSQVLLSSPLLIAVCHSARFCISPRCWSKAQSWAPAGASWQLRREKELLFVIFSKELQLFSSSSPGSICVAVCSFLSPAACAHPYQSGLLFSDCISDFSRSFATLALSLQSILAWLCLQI